MKRLAMDSTVYTCKHCSYKTTIPHAIGGHSSKHFPRQKRAVNAVPKVIPSSTTDQLKVEFSKSIKDLADKATRFRLHCALKIASLETEVISLRKQVADWQIIAGKINEALDQARRDNH